MYVFYVMFDGVCGYFCWGFLYNIKYKGGGKGERERHRDRDSWCHSYGCQKPKKTIKKTSRTMECCLKCIIRIICSSSKLMYNCYCFSYESL